MAFIILSMQLKQGFSMSENTVIQSAPVNERITVIKELPSGEIRFEVGADGVYLVFDADCLDALPYCKAHCCAHPGTIVWRDELPQLDEIAEKLQKQIVVYNKPRERLEMKRDCDGFCSCLDREKKMCEIYENRPRTCRDFHCSRGIARGWRLTGVARQKEHE